MNRSYYYKKIMEKDRELEYYSPYHHASFKKADLKKMSDEDLRYLYQNLKSSIKGSIEATHYA